MYLHLRRDKFGNLMGPISLFNAHFVHRVVRYPSLMSVGRMFWPVILFFWSFYIERELESSSVSHCRLRGNSNRGSDFTGGYCQKKLCCEYMWELAFISSALLFFTLPTEARMERTTRPDTQVLKWNIPSLVARCALHLPTVHVCCLLFQLLLDWSHF